MKVLQTSGTLNECVGQYINTALKKRDRDRKPEEMGGGGHGGGVLHRG